MNIAEMSFAGSVMVLAVIAVRTLALYRLPRQTSVWLWILTAARLLLPVALPSALSIYGLFPAGPQAIPVAEPPAVSPVGPGAAAAEPVPAPVLTASAASWDPWMAVWLAGSAATATVFAVLYIRWLRRFATSLPAEGGTVRAWTARHPLRRRLRVRQSECIAAPLTYGIFRPVILLPKAAAGLDAESLTYVLDHEYTHIRRFDALTKLVLMAAVCVHWFNPLVWVMFFLANRDLELACDESVLRNGGSRSAYAGMLIRMEEQKGLLAPFCSSCSRNALKERIKSIMKLKKYTVPMVALAAVLVICVGTALATSPPAPAPETTQTVEQDVITRLEPDGSVSCSFDGGRTFSVLTEEELAGQYGLPEVEWWTAEEYEAWLENEKTELQALLGERAWTAGDGWFTWTQEKIDETIAMYEETLEQIRSGMRISRTVDGSDDVVLAQGSGDPDVSAENPASVLEAYAPYGLTADGEGHLRYQGARVGYFEDRVELEPGMSASRYSCYNPEGTVHVRTVREATRNADGSTDPFGKLLGLERIPQAEAERLIREYQSAGIPQITVAEEETQTEAGPAAEDTGKLLEPYAAFGLSWTTDPQGQLRMRWRDRAVHCLYDEATGTWVANNMYGTDLPDSAAVHLEAVYTDGHLTALRECQPPEPQTAVTVVAADPAETTGTTFEEIFQRYEPLGLRFEAVRTEGAVRYNLFFGGQRVNHFADVSDAGTFTYDSATQAPYHGLTARVIYRDGKAVGIETE